MGCSSPSSPCSCFLKSAIVVFGVAPTSYLFLLYTTLTSITSEVELASLDSKSFETDSFSTSGFVLGILHSEGSLQSFWLSVVRLLSLSP